VLVVKAKLDGVQSVLGMPYCGEQGRVCGVDGCGRYACVMVGLVL
jgi:hypothetical protein